MYSTLDIVDDVARHQCIPNDGQITASLAKYVDVFGEAHLRRILEKYAAYYNAASYYPSLYITDTNRSSCRFRCPAGDGSATADTVDKTLCSFGLERLRRGAGS
jgi:hypothetical protein